MTKQDAYDLLLRVCGEASVRQKFLTDPTEILKETGLKVTETELSEVRTIVAAINPMDPKIAALSAELQENFARMALSLRKSILDVVDQIEAGFKKVMQMYVVAFYVGIGLLVLGGLSGLVLRENTLAFIFGGLGTADIVGSFVFKPAEELQKSRGNLGKLEMAFINWVGDAHNWDEVFRRTFKETDSPTELIDATSKISTAMLANVKDTMKAIDDYCKSKSR